MSANYMQNREISWLRFNERVLEEAASNKVRALERLKFISIFTSNLTEFFMVRIGSLTDLSSLKKDFKDNKTGMTTQEQIDLIMKTLPAMYKKKDIIFRDVNAELSKFGIQNQPIQSLSGKDLAYIKNYFDMNISPLLSPQIIDSPHPFPFLDNDKLYIFVEMQDKKKILYGLIPVRSDFPEYVILPNTDNLSFVMTENIILHFADIIFSRLNILNKTIINITRNFDFTDSNEVRDEFENYKDYMKVVIKKRKRQQAVRVESNSCLSEFMKSFLQKELQLSENNFFISQSPLKMNYAFSISNHIASGIKEKIINPVFTPFYHNTFAGRKSVMSLAEHQDIMLYYPYDDIKTFLDLIKEASEDHRVVSIKITIYRLSKNSKLVKYLCNASENGKDVTVLMELKARFDEENNINYADILYESGCTIIFGFEQFKTHSKLCLITYKDKRNVKFITQIGTGNYNEYTSKLYTDLSLITSNQEIGLDATDFFKNMGTGNVTGRYVHLLQSPYSLKRKIIKFIEDEKKKGEDGAIHLKMNSLTDKDIIEKLSECSNAGVKIKMIIRSISCIIPNIKGHTENIEIHSIVGRFLEHSRIYIFGKESNKKYFISSADLMTRNMERRIEIAVPIYDKKIQEELDKYFEIQFKDTTNGRIINHNGKYENILNKKELFSSQDYFMEKTNKMISQNDEHKDQIKAKKDFFRHIPILNTLLRK